MKSFKLLQTNSCWQAHVEHKQPRVMHIMQIYCMQVALLFMAVLTTYRLYLWQITEHRFNCIHQAYKQPAHNCCRLKRALPTADTLVGSARACLCILNLDEMAHEEYIHVNTLLHFRLEAHRPAILIVIRMTVTKHYI